MSKDRFLAFTDAIIAIIATIMVLEFHTPLQANLNGLAELLLPIFAYSLSFFLILTVWYNHHQLYKNVQEITIHSFIYNTVWLFIMSLFPFVTGWVGKAPTQLLPELIYIIITIFWMLSFQLMSRALDQDNPQAKKEKMAFTHSLSQQVRYGILFLSLIIVWFWPPIGLVSIVLLLIIVYLQFIRTAIAQNKAKKSGQI